MKKVVGLLAGLCLCAGCENEIPEPTASVVSAGKFVVDYTAAAGAATRVIHEKQPKGVRINSLTYLLYSEEVGEAEGNPRVGYRRGELAVETREYVVGATGGFERHLVAG